MNIAHTHARTHIQDHKSLGGKHMCVAVCCNLLLARPKTYDLECVCTRECVLYSWSIHEYISHTWTLAYIIQRHNYTLYIHVYIHTPTHDLQTHTSFIHNLSPASSAPSRHRACVADENFQRLALQLFYVATSIASSPLRISTWCMAAPGILISLCHKQTRYVTWEIYILKCINIHIFMHIYMRMYVYAYIYM